MSVVEIGPFPGSISNTSAKFNDSTEYAWRGNLSQLTLYSTGYGQSLQLVGVESTWTVSGLSITRIKHGSTERKNANRPIPLNCDIRKITIGTSSNSIIYLSFTLSDDSTYYLGDLESNVPANAEVIELTSGQVVKYLFGRASNDKIESIGFSIGNPEGSLTIAPDVGNTHLPDPMQPRPTFNSITKLKKSNSKIESIDVYTGGQNNIDIQGIQINYSNSYVYKTGKTDSESKDSIVLEEDEYIDEIQVFRGGETNPISGLLFWTNKGRRKPCGTTPAIISNTLVASNSVLVGLTGETNYDGNKIEMLGAAFSKSPINKVTLKNINFKMPEDGLKITNPEYRWFVSQKLDNNSSVDQSSQVRIGASTSQTETLTTSNSWGAAVEIGLEKETSLPLVGGVKASIKISGSYTFTDSKTATKGTTFSNIYVVNAVVPPKSQCRGIARLTKGTISVPWTAWAVTSYSDGTETTEVVSGVYSGTLVISADISWDMSPIQERLWSDVTCSSWDGAIQRMCWSQSRLILALSSGVVVSYEFDDSGIAENTKVKIQDVISEPITHMTIANDYLVAGLGGRGGLYSMPINDIRNPDSTWVKVQKEGWMANVEHSLVASNNLVVALSGGAIMVYSLDDLGNEDASYVQIKGNGWGPISNLIHVEGFVVVVTKNNEIWSIPANKINTSKCSWQSIAVPSDCNEISCVINADPYLILGKGGTGGMLSLPASNLSSSNLKWTTVVDDGWCAYVVEAVVVSDRLIVGLSGGAIMSFLISDLGKENAPYIQLRGNGSGQLTSMIVAGSYLIVGNANRSIWSMPISDVSSDNPKWLKFPDASWDSDIKEVVFNGSSLMVRLDGGNSIWSLSSPKLPNN